MNTLMRRAAVVLALPFVIGAPTVLLAAPAQAAVTPTITLTRSAPSPSVYGQQIVVTAVVTEPGGPVTSGAIQFDVDGVEQGPAIQLGSDGKAVSPPLFDEAGLPLDITQASMSHHVAADYLPQTSAYNESSASYDQYVDKAGSSLAVLPGPTSIVADMAGRPPGGEQIGAIKPSGSVTFTVGGATVGTATVAANGRATLSYVVPPGAARSVAASYAGDGRYTGSVDAMTRADPEIGARVLSRFPRSRSGWYRTPVDVIFSCRPHGSELAEDCPGQVTLKKSDAGQSVSRTIHAIDGGAATALVDGIDIDRDKPVVSIVDGKCRATDKLSGVKRCKLRKAPDGRHVIAIATDKAGNVATRRGLLD